MLNQIIQGIAKNASDRFGKIAETNEFNVKSWEILTEHLKEDHLKQDIRDDENFQELFAELQQIKGPVLYWFEIHPLTSSEQIRADFEGYLNSSPARAASAIKKNPNLQSRVLYVGKVKKNFWGRVIQHLGVASTAATVGLQLLHWTKENPLHLKLNALEFAPEMEDYMTILENGLAKKLEPIIGKHK